jgi:hypothetical protein
VVLLRGNLEMIPAAIDTAREAVALIDQNWRIIAGPNTAALALTALGVIGPVASTVISNGAAIVAGINALRPLVGRDTAAVTSRPSAAWPAGDASSQAEADDDTPAEAPDVSTVPHVAVVPEP